MCLILGITFWRVDFGQFYLQILYHFCFPLMICKSSSQEIWGFPSCSPGIFSGELTFSGCRERDLRSVCKGFMHVSVHYSLSCSSEEQRYGKICEQENILCECRKNAHEYAHAALIAVLAVYQTFFTPLFYLEIKMLLSWLQDCNFSKQSQDAFFFCICIFCSGLYSSFFSGKLSYMHCNVR